MNVKCTICNSTNQFHYCLDCRQSRYINVDDLVDHQKKHGHTGGHYILRLPRSRTRRPVQHDDMMQIDQALVEFEPRVEEGLQLEAAQEQAAEIDANEAIDAYVDAIVDSDDELDDGAVVQQGQRRNLQAYQVHERKKKKLTRCRQQ